MTTHRASALLWCSVACSRWRWWVAAVGLHWVSPEEVFLAVEFSLSREAFVRERGCTVWTLYTRGVPGSIQDVEQEPVEDRPLATGANNHLLSDRQRDSYERQSKILGLIEYLFSYGTVPEWLGIHTRWYYPLHTLAHSTLLSTHCYQSIYPSAIMPSRRSQLSVNRVVRRPSCW